MWCRNARRRLRDYREQGLFFALPVFAVPTALAIGILLAYVLAFAGGHGVTLTHAGSEHTLCGEREHAALRMLIVLHKFYKSVDV